MRRYWIMTYVITTLFLILGASVFFLSYARFTETIYDLVMSVCYYFCKLFEIPSKFPVTVNNYSRLFLLTSESVNMGETLEDFGSDLGLFFKLFFEGHNFKIYFNVTMEFILKLLSYVTIFAPVVILIIVLIKHFYFIPNTNYNQDTKPLRVFKWLSRLIYQPIRRFVREYKVFLSERDYIRKWWIFIWLLNFNVISIIVAFFAYYFYFALSFDISTLYRQVVKLVIDLQVLFKKVPIIFLLIIAYRMFENWRRGIAYGKLDHMERRNRGFINELPIVSMTVGSMGKKKTTVITDMAISQEIMFRNEAFKRLQKADLKFPHFPWIEFELELRELMKLGYIYNLATIKEWVRNKERLYNLSPGIHPELYNYDVFKYGFEYYDSLKVENVFDVLETYGQLYFIYIIESALLVSNFSIRVDNQLIDRDNFPLWQCDLFPETISKDSRFAHILDFDVLRLGKKVIEDNPNAGSFEFGCVVITEVGKERGNNLELKEVKKVTNETNQKNDLFNSWLKMCRHSATVDHYPFIKVFTDEQRPESWGADARELCDIVHVVSTGNFRLSLPFYTIEDMITEWFHNSFISFYYKLRHIRGDNTLFIHIFKSITAWLCRRHIRICNTFGFSVLSIEKEAGTMDQKIEKKKYFLMNKKIYSKRFSTDCFSDYFNDKAKQTNVGLDDYVTYATEKATVEELRLQNSYFVRALYGDDDD